MFIFRGIKKLTIILKNTGQFLMNIPKKAYIHFLYQKTYGTRINCNHGWVGFFLPILIFQQQSDKAKYLSSTYMVTHPPNLSHPCGHSLFT